MLLTARMFAPGGPRINRLGDLHEMLAEKLDHALLGKMMGSPRKPTTHEAVVTARLMELDSQTSVSRRQYTHIIKHFTRAQRLLRSIATAIGRR